MCVNWNSNKRKLVTIFSAPNYCQEFNNAGAMLQVDSNLRCSFKVWKSMGFIPNPTFQDPSQAMMRRILMESQPSPQNRPRKKRGI